MITIHFRALLKQLQVEAKQVSEQALHANPPDVEACQALLDLEIAIRRLEIIAITREIQGTRT